VETFVTMLLSLLTCRHPHPKTIGTFGNARAIQWCPACGSEIYDESSAAPGWLSLTRDTFLGMMPPGFDLDTAKPADVVAILAAGVPEPKKEGA
jgi:hypothetical protein